MKYMMLIHFGDAPRAPREGETNTEAVAAWNKLSEEERGQIGAGYQALNQTQGVTPGLGLAPAETATTVRVEDGQTLTTDGPFAELKEAVAGYFIFEADDLDAAIEVASKVPHASLGGAVEIRPVIEW
jgi:hypothetical protein